MKLSDTLEHMLRRGIRGRDIVDFVRDWEGKHTIKEKQAKPVTTPIAKPLDTTPVVIVFTSNTGDPVNITEAEVAKWQKAYPAIEVRQQLEAMQCWFEANPRNRKTTGGMRRFAVSWLERSQNRAPRTGDRSQPNLNHPGSYAAHKLRQNGYDDASDFSAGRLEQGDINRDRPGSYLDGLLAGPIH